MIWVRNTLLATNLLNSTIQVVEALLKLGTTAVGTQNSAGFSPIQIAAAKCQLENLELLFKYIKSCSDDPDRQRLVDSQWQKLAVSNETLLHLACR